MRILVFPADALGSLLAARLAIAGHDVELLAQGERFEQVRWHGVRLQNAETGEMDVVPVRAIDRVQVTEHFDIALVTQDSGALESVLPPEPWGRDTAIVMLPQDAADARRLLGSAVRGGVLDARVSLEGDTVSYEMPSTAAVTSGAAAKGQEALGRAVRPEPVSTAVPPSAAAREPEAELGMLLTREGEGLMPPEPEAAEGYVPPPEPEPRPGMAPSVTSAPGRGYVPPRRLAGLLALAGLALFVGWRVTTRLLRQ